jgi:archaellum component FlaC
MEQETHLRGQYHAKHVREAKGKLVETESQVQKLQEQQTSLKTSYATVQRDMIFYRNELGDSIDRTEELSQEVAQLQATNAGLVETLHQASHDIADLEYELEAYQEEEPMEVEFDSDSSEHADHSELDSEDE